MDSDDSYLDDDEYYYYNEEEDQSFYGGSSQGTYCGFQPFFLTNSQALPTRIYLTPEEADRNARKLLEEEEREKEKANKKRLKKKRQKDRRRQQKQLEAQDGLTAPQGHVVTAETSQRAPAGSQEPDCSTSASEDDLDLGSTFVRKAQQKVASKPKSERRAHAKERSRERAQDPPKESAPERSREKTPAADQPDLHNKVIKINILDRYNMQESMELANIGNNMAGCERFAESIHFYTEALKINPSEYRFLGNRSYSYERLGQHKEALADAERALQLKPDFLKGHFRKGKALRGLKRYPEAIAAFQQVLMCDANHIEAAWEIKHCQQKLQEAMAGTRVKILSGAHLSVPPKPLGSAPAANQKVFPTRNIYNTKFGPPPGNPPTKAVCPPTPGNPQTGATDSKLFPIWVGNVTNAITEEILRSAFDQFGSLHSIRMLHSRKCAFVNFTSKDAAELAYDTLQGLNIGGNMLTLQLRNPEHSSGGRKK